MITKQCSDVVNKTMRTGKLEACRSALSLPVLTLSTVAWIGLQLSSHCISRSSRGIGSVSKQIYGD